MKPTFPGVKRIEDDVEILMMMESEGILKTWDSLKDKFKDMARVFAYETKTERWIIWECIGVPGDEGLMMLAIKKKVLGHPVVRHTLATLESLLELDISTLIEFHHTPPNRERN